MIDLKDKNAVITGGNSGIGYSTAKLMKERGANVIIVGRSQERVSKAAGELGVTGLVADVSKVKEIEHLVENVKKTTGKIDILFINAGVFFGAPIGQITEELFDQLMNINFKGAVFTLEKFLPLLTEGSSVINLSSVNAYLGMSTASIYGASKAAMNSFTRTSATELAARKIRVNAVNPGPVSTPIFGKTGMNEDQLQGFASAMQNRVPLKRFGNPDEIAKLVTFLASDDASYITGAEYNIDGGININPGII
ncbi:MAG: SDR family oxidoreductase [Leptospiraceae bacterium]|nr:SDR family oxidoreductase [Leptospiraceae bacterium]